MIVSFDDVDIQLKQYFPGEVNGEIFNHLVPHIEIEFFLLEGLIFCQFVWLHIKLNFLPDIVC